MKCILCNGDKTIIDHEISSEIINNHWIRDFQFDVRYEYGIVKTFYIIKCCSCKLSFFYPIIAGSNKLYQHLQYFDWYYMPNKWEYDKAIEDLYNSEKILEVGSGFGSFINKVINEIGNVIEGIELNDTAVSESQHRGLPVKSIDLQKFVQEFSGQYDAVCSFQVLEHVPNPREFLDNMCRLLKPGGKLILGLPNANSFIKHQFNILDMPPHHTTRWLKSTLEYMPELFPFQLEHIKFEPLAVYHVEGYVSAYISYISKLINANWFNKPKLISFVSKIIKKTRINNFLRGQSIYVSYIKK